MRHTLVTGLLCALSVSVLGEEKKTDIDPLLSPDQVENQQALDREANPLYESRLLAPVADGRDKLAEKTGLSMSVD